MKLRNKKTGVIIPIEIHYIGGKNYETLKEINEDWEDYEEPKEHWYVDCDGEIMSTPEALCNESQKDMKQIGNYFSTKEAEKAIEKLKTWKRLKDKGFKFNNWFTRVLGGLQINVKFDEYNGISPEDKKDLDLLFGREE